MTPKPQNNPDPETHRFHLELSQNSTNYNYLNKGPQANHETQMPVKIVLLLKKCQAHENLDENKRQQEETGAKRTTQI